MPFVDNLGMLTFARGVAGYIRAMTVRPDGRYSAPSLRKRACWFLRAGPADYLLAMSVASASLPLIGKRLEPLGAATAMGIWGYKHVPDFFSNTARSRDTSDQTVIRKQELESTNAVIDAALRGIVSAADLAIDWPVPDRYAPVLKMRQHRRSLHRASVRYGDHPSQLLDVWRPKELPVEPAPVMIFVPGGAWIHGGRQLQGYALMSYLAQQGWVCLSVNYRVSPHNRWPRTHHRCEDRDRMGARQRRPIRWRPKFRCDSGVFGRWPPVGAGRSDAERSRVAGRPAGGL